MVLVIDIGNSNVVLGLFEGEQLKFHARLATDPNKTVDEYSADFYGIFAVNGILPLEFEGVMISSVVPPLTKAVCSAAEKLAKKPPLVIGPGIKTGFKIGIDNPAQLGSDLVANVAGALTQYKPPFVIVDLGTATTMTVVSGEGEILGGAIAPGVGLSMRALSSNTAQLPHIDLQGTEVLLGSNTEDAMRSGIVFGTAAMIDGMIANFERELGCELKVIATGGLSSQIVAKCRHAIEHNPFLLLQGLRTLYERNATKDM